jgi:hypothetical protein
MASSELPPDPGSAGSLACPRCGAPATFPADSSFATCPFCSSALFLDGRATVLCYAAKATVDGAAARGFLEAWMAGPLTAAGLEREAVVQPAGLVYLPWWRGLVRGSWRTTPGAVVGFGDAVLPAPSGGELGLLDPATTTAALPAVRPERSAAEARSRLGGEGVERIELLYVPVYRFRYQASGVDYSALVDGITGTVYADRFPPKVERPLLGVALAAVAVLVVVGLAAPTPGWRAGLYLLAAGPLLAVFTQALRRLG